MDQLKHKILSYTHIEASVLDDLLTSFERIAIPKGAFLLRAEQYAQHMYFLEKGCVCFYTIHDGKEQVLEIFVENDLFTDLYSYLKEAPSKCFLKSLEPCEILTISKKDYEAIFQKSHAMEHFLRKNLEEEYLNVYINSTNKSALSNEERYLRLLRKRPNLFQRVPQYLIASYLGLTPVGLSKIRKRLSQA